MFFIYGQGILPEKKLVDSRCLRAPPASQQRARSPEIQLAVGKLLRELRRQGPHAKRVNHQVSAAGRPKVGDVDLKLQRRVRSAEGGRESYVPRLPGLPPNAQRQEERRGGTEGDG